MTPRFDIESTLISQYANSPTIVQLVQNMGQYVDTGADLNTFYDFVWNVDTAQGFGLDIWGRIVGIGRDLNIPGVASYLGFTEAFTEETADTGPQPFGQAPFYSGPASTTTYTLADDAYRKLILVKALGNISDCSVPSLNQLLQNLFAGRGRCYVTDTGAMEMRFVFEFNLLPYEIAVLTNSGAVPRPAAVSARLVQIAKSTTFGFFEGFGQPFGSGVFFSTSGLIDAS